MKKKIIIAISSGIVVVAVAVGFFALKKYIFPQKIVGELKVLSYTPAGEEVPISTDGITVMFDRAVVPITTLDSGRSRGISLNIKPSVSGKFFWLGTHGFIFRPEEPFTPATKYSVEMPAGIVSIDGYRLNTIQSWEFTTVLPRVNTWEPSDGQMLLPKQATMFLHFNMAMNRGDVESKLSVIDTESNQPVENKPVFIWGDNDHTLTIQFKDKIPWDKTLKITLPKGTLAAKGDMGIAEDISVSYSTPSQEMTLEKVDASAEEDHGYGERKVIEPGKKAHLKAGAGICFTFSQSIEKKSFERAFHGDLAGAAGVRQKKPQPYFYFLDLETFPILDDKGRTQYIEGYKQGCVAFLDEAGTAYEFSIDPAKIESVSGATLKGGAEKYMVATLHAEPEIRSLITKNIVSSKGSMRIPYRVVNLSAVTLNLYKLKDKSEYSESIKNEYIEGVDEKSTPPMSLPLAGDKIRLPIDPDTLTIDQARMPAFEVYEVPLEIKQDASTKFVIDLTELPQKPPAGLYLLEAVGTPSIEMKSENDLTVVYSMIQITPIAIALKRDVDHVLVYTTDIESGSPVAALPVQVSATRWNYNQDKWEQLGSAKGVTNEQGVAVIAMQTVPEADICTEVTAVGSESFSCDNEHQISEYGQTLRTSAHHYAYIYTDRPIYRPGQKVFFSSFIREVREGRYFTPQKGTEVSVVVTDASGATIFKEEKAKIEPGGIVSGSFDLSDAENVPRGAYMIAMEINKQQMSKTFIVSSYRKPSFKVEIKAEKTEIVSGQPLKADVTGSYFFGAPLKKSPASWSIMTSTYIFAPEGFADYSFIDEDLLRKRPGEEEGETGYMSDYEYDILMGTEGSKYAEDQPQYDDPREQSATGGGSDFFKDPQKWDLSSVPVMLNDEGKLLISYTPDLKKYPTSQELSVEASVTDPSQQQVSASEDIIVHKAQFYLGVKPKKWVYGAKEKAEVELVSLDTAGKLASGKSFKVDVVRREYKYIERRNARGYWELEFEPKDTVLTTLDGKTDSNGAASVAYALPGGGEYRFVVKGKDAKGNEVQSAQTIFAWGEGYVPWRVDEPEKIELVPDKDSYKVGETAKILVKSLVPVTKALMTLERGRVLEYRIIDLGGNAAHIELPITEGMMPNLYVNLVAHVGNSPDHPPLLYSGEAEIHVEPEQKRLNIAITTDKKAEGDMLPSYRPQEEVKVRIKTTDPDGKPLKAHVMVSVADESVLRLLNYKLPDLVKKFYYRRPNSVITSSSLLSLKAGDAGTSKAKRRRIFKDTAYFAADITTDDNGEALFSFKLPDDLTTWVIEALGATDSKSLEEFEAERQKREAEAPKGQSAVGADLALTDGTFVGGARAKLMTTLPLVLRTALPRFAAWGDDLTAKVIATNRTAENMTGSMLISVSGDGALKGDKPSKQTSFTIPANDEKVFPVEVEVRSASGKLMLAADAKNEKGDVLDSLETSIPVLDRFAPEIVASAGSTKAEEKEAVDLPKDTLGDKGGLDISLRASIALAAAPSLRNLIYFAWGCSEQKSATLLALLMARDMTERFGEAYFDALAPIEPEKAKAAKGVSEKKALLDERIVAILDELFTKFQQYDGGMRYWPESFDSDYLASAQTLAALASAKEQGFTFDETARGKLKVFVRQKVNAQTNDKKFILDADKRAYGLFALTLDKGAENISTNEWLSQLNDMSVSGLSYLLMAFKNENLGADISTIKARLLSQAKQEPRYMSWPASAFFWSSAEKNTALAAMALLSVDPNDVSVPRALDFLLNRKKITPCQCTQDNLYVSWLVTSYAKIAKEEDTDFTAQVEIEKKKLIEKLFSKDNLTAMYDATMPMKELKDLTMPADVRIEKDGTGTLYYDMVLKYYLPPDKAPTREEGIIISREYYALDDVKEKKPLVEFKAGENYKGHITIVVPQEMNYIVVQDLLPAGFEPIDMQLATSSRAAALEASQGGESYENQWDETLEYDDVVTQIDYGMSFGFLHQEVRDDSIVWSDEWVPPGVYHIRYPVRATTAGEFLMPGAIAFEFYRPEIFGRSRTREIEIK